jgi:hypothetical protein
MKTSLREWLFVFSALLVTTAAAQKRPNAPTAKAPPAESVAKPSTGEPDAKTAGKAKESSNPNQASEAFIGTVRSEAEKSLLKLAIDWSETLPVEVFAISSPNFIWKIQPSLKIETGDKDAFSGVVGKLTLLGSYIPESILGDTNNGIFIAHTFPVSVGVESDGDFRTINGLLEAGYVPWFTPSALDWLPKGSKGRWTILPGIFIQAGYKFSSDAREPGEMVPAGSADKDASEENESDMLFRAKASLKIKSPIFALGNIADYNLGLQGIAGADLWYDLVNDEVYHRITGTLRVHVSETKSFDFKYEHGEGAPNFNRGEQFSLGLTILF